MSRRTPVYPSSAPPEVMAQIEAAAIQRARLAKREQPGMSDSDLSNLVERAKRGQLEAYCSVPANIMATIESAAAKTREVVRCDERDRAEVMHEQRMKLIALCAPRLAQRRQMLEQADRLSLAAWPTLKGEATFEAQGTKTKVQWRFERPGLLIVTDKNSGDLLAQSLPAQLTELDLMAPLAGLV